MVECRTVTHQNAKVMIKKSKVKKTRKEGHKYVIMQIVICQMIEWICGTYSLFTVWNQIYLKNHTPHIYVLLRLSPFV